MKQKTKLWEYLIVDNIDINKLNELGTNGWELVSVVFFPMFEVNNLQSFPMTKAYFKKVIR